ncbi:hypothetical protein LCGC14_3081120 [marine sediment metagenome]|uniref:Uncharacterized protein n=1 Tax=marine sediment metagenome TaxID=412755 RepID=A0A0F8WE22_9ZZZZ
MSDKIRMEDVFDPKTVQLMLKLMKLRRKSKENDGLSMNMVLRFIIQREIQIIKDDYPTVEDLRERNINRFTQLQEQKVNPNIYCAQLQEQKENPDIYCAQIHMEIGNLMRCQVSCSFGHMTECHYPYDCNSDFCQHYKAQRDAENQIDMEYINSGDGPVI